MPLRRLAQAGGSRLFVWIRLVLWKLVRIVAKVTVFACRKAPLPCIEETVMMRSFGIAVFVSACCIVTGFAAAEEKSTGAIVSDHMVAEAMLKRVGRRHE